MALSDTERRTSGWRCSKTALQEEEAINLLKEFAELKRKERANDPAVKFVKNKYKLKASAYPSPGNILHTGRQLSRSPGPGVLPLLPSQEFELREPGEESSEQLMSFPVIERDNIVPSGKQLPRSPFFIKPDHVLKEIQPNSKNVTSAQKLVANNSAVSNTTIIISNIEPDTLKDLENENPMGELSAHKVEDLPDTERRTSGWRCSKTALHEEEAINLLKEFAELKRKERENDPKVKNIKEKYKLKASAYPSPRNILHTGRELPRSPGHGVLPLLPSQAFQPQEPVVESFEKLSSFPIKDLGNIVPSGKQLQRTPLSTEPEPHILTGIQPKTKNVSGTKNLSRIANSLGRCNTTVALSNEEDLNMPDTLKDLENKNPVFDICAHKETTEEENVSSHQTCNRRISELPVKGLSQMRISGVLKKMPGYECRSEDLEFLTYMKTQEKAKMLKESSGVSGTKNLSRTANSLGRCNTTVALSNEEDLNMPDTLKDLENKNPVFDICAHKETTEEGNVCSHKTRNRRISELPVQGLSQMRISGVLKKMPGYECRSEDLEFLTYMKIQEKAKMLKAELLCLRKDLATTNQDKELVIAKKDKIEDDIQRMKLAYEGTVRLGRAFLSRTQDAATVQGLPPKDVLKQLNHLTVQNVHQQERAQLLAAQKELSRRQEEVASVTRHLEDTKSLLISKIESHKECANTAEERLQRLSDEVITLKTQIEKTVKKKSELEDSIQKKREQISQCLEQPSALPTQTDMSEEERERMNRSLQRILHRKNLYLERERILRKLKRDLK
ncbi:uncharacterized protein ACMZJ9_001344 [Mantella aurantiaca]